MTIKFNINDLAIDKFETLEVDDNGLTTVAYVLDTEQNKVFVKNIVWENDKITGFYIQDKLTQPEEILVINVEDDNFNVIQTITNLTYASDGLAKAFFKTTKSKEKFFVYDIEYDEKERIIYCKQRQENGTEREFFDFVFDKNGKFSSCKQKMLGTNKENSFDVNFMNMVMQKTTVSQILANILNRSGHQVTKEEEEMFLQKLTSLLQILSSIKSNAVSSAFTDTQYTNNTDIINHKRYKLNTPLLQVFSSLDNIQSDINGEETLMSMCNILSKRLSGIAYTVVAPVLARVSDNLSSIILDKVHEGNYQLNSFGEKIIDLGYSLSAKTQGEALNYAINHLYYNAVNLLDEDQLLKYHYKNIDNFLLIKL